uniref:Uncharacterized protein n=1 Tax=Solanum tuberosum TaxID=4113 RepID=M1E167_SOLTU
MGLEKNNSSELVSDVSKITFSNANELSTRKATDNISTRVQQLMIENSNFVDHAIEVDHQVSQFSQREKELARILCRHINQKSHHIEFGETSVELSTLQESYESTRNGGTSTTVDDFAMLDNVYSIPHSTELTPIISGS